MKISGYVGKNVEASLNTDTGMLQLYSNGGTLWRNWLERAKIQQEMVKNIKIAEGTVVLPQCVSGLHRNHYYMFAGLFQLREIDWNGFDASNVKDASWRFADNYNLVKMDMSGLSLSQIVLAEGMFYNCRRLTEVDISGMGTEHVTNMQQMFAYCTNLKLLHMPQVVPESILTGNMYKNCPVRYFE